MKIMQNEIHVKNECELGFILNQDVDRSVQSWQCRHYAECLRKRKADEDEKIESKVDAHDKKYFVYNFLPYCQRIIFFRFLRNNLHDYLIAIK